MSPAGKSVAQILIPGSGSAGAAAVVRAARRVLVTGLAGATPAVLTAACDLAEAIGAAIDTGSTDLASPLGPVVTRAGGITADPEELRDRADLVVAWFCDPEAQSPGFRSAFLEPPLTGGARRRVLAVGPDPVAGAGGHLSLPREAAVDLARLLHALLLGHDPPRENSTAASLGGACRELVAAIRAAACVGFVTARAADPLGLAAWATRLLVRAIAHERAAFEISLDDASCGRGDGPGAADVLTWRYGAAGGIARADRLGATFRPAECAADALVARDEVDVVLAVGRLPEAVEAAIASRATELVVIRIDAGTAAESLTAMLRAVAAQPASGAAR